MGIFSGLDIFGLGGLAGADIDIFESEQEEGKKAPEAKPARVEQPMPGEADLVFAKRYKCPCCDKEFKAKTVKTGKVKLVDMDMDLRPKYSGMDPLKYDVILCPHCGYAALSRFFQYLTGGQAKLIGINISQAFKYTEKEGNTYTYDQAIEHYKLALANAIVKKAKASERAYICLKLGWVIRGKEESLDSSEPDHDVLLEHLKADEDEALKNAFEGFQSALMAEPFPMCGMDEITVDYIIAVLAYRFDKLDVSAKLVSSIIVSNMANKRMKDKARELKDMIVARIKSRK